MIECNKINVFVAEDEPIILKSIVKKVEDSDEIFSVIGTAFNGKLAFSKICEQKPDLLITDIKMPIWDGIELIREIRTIMPNLPIIIISGYGDFTYAQSAIKLGVTDFLLKPLTNNQLNQTMASMKSKIIVHTMRVQREILQCKLTDSTMGELPNNFKDCHFWIYLLSAGVVSDNIMSIIHEGFFRKQWEKIDFNELLNNLPIKLNGWWLIDENTSNQKFLVLACNKSEVYSNRAGQAIFTYITDKINHPINICAHNKPIDYHEIFTVAYKTRLALISKLSIGYSNFFTNDSLGANSETDLISSSIQNKLCSAASMEELCRIITCIFYSWKELHINLANFNNGIRNIINGMNKCGLFFHKAVDAYEVYQGISNILALFESDTSHDIYDDILKLFLDKIEACHKEREESHVFADRIEEYINQNYKECISIALIADCYHVSQAYVTKVFKNSKNISPMRFLTNLRIEKAKAMIQTNPGMDFALIGELVGYCDQHYFSRTFKKNTGITLSDYRKNITKEQIRTTDK